MTVTRRVRGRRRGRVNSALGGLCVVAIAVLLAIGPYARDAGGSSTARAAASSPLPMSLTTGTGTWASVPMGHLGQPLNTFWQLFYLSGQGGKWVNHADALGIATNGGLLLGAPDPQSLVVAVRPSNNLTYSAVVGTTGGGLWAPGPPVPGAIDALAVGPQSRRLALVADASGGRLLSAGAGSTNWQRLVTAASLASSAAGSGCVPLGLTAVAFDPTGLPVVGASCARSGSVGIFEDAAGGWRAIGPPVPGSPTESEVQALSVQAVGGQLTAVFSMGTGSATTIVEGWAQPGGNWELSGGLDLGRGHIVSIGSVPSGGYFVLYSDHAGLERLATIVGPGSPWVYLANPPKGTQTVAFPAPGRVDALAVADTVMTDWVLDESTSSWTKHQVSHVEILFGSSS